MAWTETRIEELCALWMQGHSASRIAVLLGAVSRSAVLGKIHRLRAAGKVSPERGWVKIGTRRSVKRCALMVRQVIIRDRPPCIPAAFTPMPEEWANRPLVPLLALKPHMCRWPIGEPGTPGFGFCGCQKVPGFSYCPRHVRAAHQPAKPRTSP